MALPSKRHVPICSDLYYVADPKLVELGLLSSPDAYKAQYYTYLMNGLMTQLVRIEPGNTVEEAHMRNRQLIARWVFEKGAADKVVEMVKKDGKTYVVINDYQKVRELFGELLAEIQRIKSTGDFEGARALVENYAVKVDPVLHAEVSGTLQEAGSSSLQRLCESEIRTGDG